MVKSSFNYKAVTGFIIIFFLLLIMQAQSKNHNQVLEKYRKWSIIGGPVLFDKAKLVPQYGNYTFENLNMPGFNFGIEYDFYPDRRWSLITGLLISKEPVYSVRYSIYKYDLFPEWASDINNKDKMYASFSFSIPLILRLNFHLERQSFASVLTGFKAMYFPLGNAEMVHTIISQELSESREIFGLKLVSPENPIQGSFIIGAGFSHAYNKFLFKTNLVYVINFQERMSGEYQFANLFSSPDTRGYYNLSGNHLGLQLSISLKK